MQCKTKEPIDVPKTNIGVDVRALTHYLSNMVYTGRHDTLDADAYIGKYKLKHCKKCP